MNEDEIRQFDESTTLISRTLPSALWSLFSEFVKQGFSDKQALDLTKAYMKCVLGGTPNEIS